MLRSCALLSALSCGYATAFAQLPSILPGGVVNAASGVNSDPGHYGLAVGSLASIFGTNLASGTQAATSTPLPFSLLGTSVSMGGIAAPLLYVSPTQINVQVPNRLPFSQGELVPASVVVTTPAGSSTPVNIWGAESGGGLFTLTGAGCGPGAIQNVSSSGDLTLNSPSNSATPGQFVTLYGTGLGSVPMAQMDGVPAPTQNPLSLANAPPFPPFSGPSIPLQSFSGSYSFLGLAPGLVGVDQVNIRISDPTLEGCAVPLSVRTSQPVTISIHRGGGACIDPPPAADGIILLQRVTTAGTANDGTAETLTATFTQSPGRVAIPIKLPFATAGQEFALPTPTCPIPGYRQLDAGTLTLKTPSTTISDIKASGTGYSATLPTGTLQPGLLTLSSSVPATVGAFQVNFQFGSDIQILLPPPPLGSTMSTLGTITPSWSGGDPDSMVTVFVISHYAQERFFTSCQAPASAGKCTIQGFTYLGVTYNGATSTEHGEILYQIDPPSVMSFSAPGLSLGGQATWRIQHSFQGFAFSNSELQVRVQTSAVTRR